MIVCLVQKQTHPLERFVSFQSKVNDVIYRFGIMFMSYIPNDLVSHVLNVLPTKGHVGALE